MIKTELNAGFASLGGGYLFSETARRIRAFEAENPGKKVIRLGIGDVTLPLGKTVVDAMLRASAEMGERGTFRGYCPEAGYGFLRSAVARYYARRGVDVRPEEIFISDGAKSDCAAVPSLFGAAKVYIPDPVYPVYLDTNLLAGRETVSIPALPEDGFLPGPERCGGGPAVIYLCSPDNPTGAAYGREGLAAWVVHAINTGSVIIYDAAYEAYITEPGVPHTIYEIPGAKSCAVEINSLSKSAGFTGTRCGWSVFPRELGELGKMWARRQAASFNGVSYIVQRAAEAALSPAGLAESAKMAEYYLSNARLISRLLDEKGIFHTGGVNSPYIWMRCPDGCGSWEFFDRMLTSAGVAGTPGAGFGKYGEGFFRLTAFSAREDTETAVARLREFL
ncbi:MAG: LL-diaminopimelate aminotransferase [Clostridia bacterium]|nr:LL-diaminopimelate aminotransferase [Clostridia bacterium]